MKSSRKNEADCRSFCKREYQALRLSAAGLISKPNDELKNA
jgi:hypothetical protein